MKHVVIIGGGVIGLMTAYYCRKQGHQVTVIEREPQLRDGCSFGNAGIVVPSHFVPLAAPGMLKLGLKWMLDPESPFYIRPRLSWELISWGFKFSRSCTPSHVQRASVVLRDLHLASRARFVQLAEEFSNEFALQQQGLLMLCATRHGCEEEARTADMAKQLGIPADVLTAEQAADLEPNMTMSIRGAVYYPRDCHLSPRLLMTALDSKLESDTDCELRWDTPVTGFVVDRSQRNIIAAETTQGTINGDAFVLATGAWSPKVARDLQLKLPMQAGKGYSLTLPEPCQLPTIPAILTEARVAVTPLGTSLRFGGTMELAGMTREINPRRVRGITGSVPQYFPKFKQSDFANITPWAGLRPCTPDGLPFVGKCTARDNLVIATGHAMMGISLGPITGDIVSKLVSSLEPDMDVSLLSPDRYRKS